MNLSDAIPKEALYRVWHYLPLDDRIRLQYVCKTCKQISFYSDISEVFVPDSIKTTQLEVALKYVGRYAQKVSFDKVTNNKLNMVTCGCPNLKSLILNGGGITKQALQKMTASVEELSLGCTLETVAVPYIFRKTGVNLAPAEGLKEASTAISGLCRLKKLTLLPEFKLKWSGPGMLSPRLPSLSEFVCLISDREAQQKIDIHDLCKFAPGLISLTTLNPQVVTKESFGNLRKLCLKKSPVTNTTLTNLLNMCSRLGYLDISECKELTEFNFAGVPHLETLLLNNTNFSYFHKKGTWPKHLLRMEILETPMLNFEVEEMLKNTPTLVWLKISFKSEKTDYAAFQILAQRLLETLLLEGIKLKVVDSPIFGHLICGTDLSQFFRDRLELKRALEWLVLIGLVYEDAVRWRKFGKPAKVALVPTKVRLELYGVPGGPKVCPLAW